MAWVLMKYQSILCMLHDYVVEFWVFDIMIFHLF